MQTLWQQIRMHKQQDLSAWLLWAVVLIATVGWTRAGWVVSVVVWWKIAGWVIIVVVLSIVRWIVAGGWVAVVSAVRWVGFVGIFLGVRLVFWGA